LRRKRLAHPRSDEGFIEGSVKDVQTVRSDWMPAQTTIHDVQVREVRNLTKGRGCLTEIFRSDWGLDEKGVDQVFQVLLDSGEVSGWHMHRTTLDRLFVSFGAVRIVLYDGRSKSSTYGLVNEFRFGAHRPALVLVPPGVWHGLQNLKNTPGLVLNIVDRAYSYEDPDHWRLPWDSPKIPYRFTTSDADIAS
jgi:dTDP-4-dehydrorhamnose 3,5-epimerase